MMVALAAFPRPCSNRGGTGATGEAAGFEVSAGAGGPIGVKECETYVEQYEACIKKMPAPQRDPLLASFDTQRNVYRELAKTDDKAELAKSCQAAIDALKEKCP